MPVAPMLASTVAPPANLTGWAVEVKWDGVRAVCEVREGHARIWGRNGHEITDRYPELARLPESLTNHEAVVDGEVVLLGADGLPDFGALGTRAHLVDAHTAKEQSRSLPVTYVVFDLLAVDGHSTVVEPYQRRRERLETLKLEGDHWTTPGTWPGDRFEAVRATTAEAGLEGLVLKKLTSPYLPGRRSAQWRKVKHRPAQEVVVVGWTERRGGKTGDLGALVVAVYGDDGLHWVGSVGSGLDEAIRAQLLDMLADLTVAEPPVAERPRFDSPVHWVQPKVVVEVAFTEWTSRGHLRQPSYRGIRTDKDPSEVRRER